MYFVYVSDSLLPDSFPEGDPSDYALPVFLEEPSDSFATKAAPAVLRCRAAHAVEVCNLILILINFFILIYVHHRSFSCVMVKKITGESPAAKRIS